MHVTAAFVLAAILKCWLYANLYHLPAPFAEDGRGHSGIGRGKSIGLAEGILLPAEAVDSSRSRPKLCNLHSGNPSEWKTLRRKRRRRRSSIAERVSCCDGELKRRRTSPVRWRRQRSGDAVWRQVLPRWPAPPRKRTRGERRVRRSTVAGAHVIKLDR